MINEESECLPNNSLGKSEDLVQWMATAKRALTQTITNPNYISHSDCLKCSLFWRLRIHWEELINIAESFQRLQQSRNVPFTLSLWVGNCKQIGYITIQNEID